MAHFGASHSPGLKRARVERTAYSHAACSTWPRSSCEPSRRGQCPLRMCPPALRGSSPLGGRSSTFLELNLVRKCIRRHSLSLCCGHDHLRDIFSSVASRPKSSAVKMDSETSHSSILELLPKMSVTTFWNSASRQAMFRRMITGRSREGK